MAEESLITDEMRKMVGYETPMLTYEIEKEPIRRWADAIGDPNPLYHDEEYARSRGYRSIIAPPGFVPQYRYPAQGGEWPLRLVKTSLTRSLNGGNEYEFFKPAQAGDVLTAITKVVDLYERKGKMGMMLFQTMETTFRNQDGDIVVKARYTGISY
jgi:acyl dehydratase